MAQLSRRPALAGLGLALIFGVALPAAAQPGPGAGRGPGIGPGPGPAGGPPAGGPMGLWTTPAYLDRLKGELAITPQQEPAWKSYADSVTAASAQMQAAHQTMFEAMGTADWQERRQMMNNMFATRQAVAASVREAAGKLLPALDPAQRAKADAILPGLAGGRRGMRGGMGGMMGRGPRP